MSFNEAMNRMLPAINGVMAHVTAEYGEERPSGLHGGIDFNYMGGQSGINLQHPVIHAPIDGVVTFVGGGYGTIKIQDASGNSHEILHTHTQLVANGSVTAGDAIGTMGGRGPSGESQYAQHVHYQLKNVDGSLVSPRTWWDQHPPQQLSYGMPLFVDDVAHPAWSSSDSFSPASGDSANGHETAAMTAKSTGKKYIVVGDPTTHGGVVISGSAAHTIDGKPIARKGDKVSCPLMYPNKKPHGVNAIIEGDDSCTLDGVPVALEGHKTECGCALIGTVSSMHG